MTWAAIFDVQISRFTRGIINATEVPNSALPTTWLQIAPWKSHVFSGADGADLECSDRIPQNEMYLTVSDPPLARYLHSRKLLTNLWLLALSPRSDAPSMRSCHQAMMWLCLVGIVRHGRARHCSPRGNTVTTHRRISRLLRPVA